DVVPRIIGQQLEVALKQPVLIENKAGAEGTIGIAYVAKAPADGYVLGVATSGPIVIGKRLFPNISYEPRKDLVPLVLTYETPFVLVVGPSFKGSTLQDFFAYARQNPGKLNGAIPNSGSVQHLLTEMMKTTVGINTANIPYKGGGPAVTDTAGGQVDFTWAALPNAIAFINAGKLRALAVSGATRDRLLPSVPTLAESGWPTLVATNWNGLVAPAGTPQPVLDQLNREINAALEKKEVLDKFSQMGVSPLGGSQAAFRALLDAEEVKWAAVIKAANIQPE
ncbi:MAG: hypothetical protein JWP29_2097, partial [Rhodoferax sp.]|nr:hypothetical protein [Rhodoferax sp.]